MTKGSVTIEGVRKTYGQGPGAQEVLRDVNATIRSGEFVVLLGPSGCGKTTLLNMIGGFLSPSSGVIKVDDAEVVRPQPSVMTVFQDFDQLFFWRSVYDNVAFPLRVIEGCARDEIERRVRRVLTMVGLWAFKDYYPGALSGGMKQRASIARALALEPSVLLMDEPFGSLDALSRSRLQGELKELWASLNNTVIFVTHSIEEAAVLGTRVLAFTTGPDKVLIDFQNESPADTTRLLKELLLS